MKDITQSIKAFLAFLDAETWIKGKEVVEQYQVILLDKRNEGFFNMLIGAARSHNEAHKVLNTHLEVLRQCRFNGIDSAFDRFSTKYFKPRLPTDFDLSQALDAWLDQMLQSLFGPLGKIMRRIFKTIKIENLSPNALPDWRDIAEITNDISSQPSNAKEIARRKGFNLSIQFPYFKAVAEQIVSGIIQRDPEIKKTIVKVYDSIEQHLEGLVNAASWDDSRDYLKAHADVLLSTNAEHVLDKLFREANQNDDSRTLRVLVSQCRNLLKRSRIIGVDAAYAEFLGHSEGIPTELSIRIQHARKAEHTCLTMPSPASLDEAAAAWIQVLHEPNTVAIPLFAQRLVHDSAAEIMWLRYIELEELSDLDHAIELQMALVKLSSNDQDDLSLRLFDLSAFLRTRFKVLYNLSDIDEAITCLKRLLEPSRHDPSWRATILYLLGSDLNTRYQETSSDPNITDLDDAIMYFREAITLPCHSSANPVLLYKGLGNSLRDRFAATNDPKDQLEASEYFRRSKELE